MLKEIFDKIAAETESHLLVKGLATTVKIGPPVGKISSNTVVYIAMQEYGIDPILKNHMPASIDDTSSTPNYSHLISFYIVPVAGKYTKRLQLIEAVVELFELKPFFHLPLSAGEFELSISMKTVTTTIYEQFWLAQQLAPQPVVFYQARVSSF